MIREFLNELSSFFIDSYFVKNLLKNYFYFIKYFLHLIDHKDVRTSFIDICRILFGIDQV